jgi:hypothetical protein
MKRYLFALTPFCLVVSTLAAGDESIVYDGTTYVIPVPSGFVRYDQSFPQLAEPTKRAIASFNDLLSAYARQDDLLKVQTKAKASLGVTCQVQATRSLHGIDVGSTEFGQIKDQMKSNYKSFDMSGMLSQSENALSDYIQKEMHTGGGVKLNQPQVTEVFDDRPNSLSFTVVVNVKVTGNGENKTIPGVSIGSIVNAHKRAINLYCATQYNGPESIQEAKTVLAQWRDQVLQANSDTANNPAPAMAN